MTTEANPPIRKTLSVLIGNGVIVREQAEIVLAQQRHLSGIGTRRSVGELTLLNSFAEREQVSEAIAKTTGKDVGVATFQLLLPIEICLRHRVIPIRLDEDRVLIVQSSAAISPGDVKFLVDTATAFLDEPVAGLKSIAAPRDHIERSLANLRHATSSGLGESLQALEADPENGELMTKVIGDLFLTAANRRASDIHLQWDSQSDEMCWISLRIDGSLKRAFLMTKQIAAALVRRIKDLSDMDPSESRKQQDGRYSFEYLNRPIDVRVAAQPTIVGETIVMRLLDPASLRSLAHLFPGQEAVCAQLEAVTRIKGKEGGIMVVSGATGQGKTTTLYAMIRALSRHNLHVLTIEDPVEFKFPFVSQLQYNPLVHSSMADLMKGVMREDPDIIVVGETRDADTTVLALRAAESGHLIMTTLHTSDAFQIYDRLISLHPGGAREATLPLANNLRGALHQMLSQRLCPHCSESAEVPISHPMRRLHQIETANIAKGCERCDHTGYYGRVAIPEAIFLSSQESVRSAVIEHFTKGGNLRNLPEGEGITVFRRATAVCELLSKGVIDLVWGSRILGYEQKEAA